MPTPPFTDYRFQAPGKVHKITLARQVLRDYKGTTGLFPTGHIPALRDAAIRKFADRIELEVAAQ